MRKKLVHLRRLSRHPIAIPVVAFWVFLCILALGYIFVIHPKPKYDTRVVIIRHDGALQTVPSKEPTVGALLQKLNITLGQGDVVEPAITTPIKQDDFRINVYRAVPVEVVDGATKTYAFSAATTPRAIASQTGTALYAEDDVQTMPTANFLRQGAIGEQVVINRATPVSVNVYGTPEIIRTHAKTIGDLLKQKGIKLAKNDQVSPAATTPITAGQQILIARNGTRLDQQTQVIPMPVQYIDDGSLAYGTTAIRQQGANGSQISTYQVNLVNGQETGRSLISTVVVQQPVTQIVVRGTSLSGIKGDMALAGISSSDYTFVDYIVSHESGWCPTKAQGQYGGCPAYAGYVPSSGGYGLCQSTPGSKMASEGSDWATNPVTQLRWCNGYAVGHYGSWSAAYNHWINNHWW